MNDNFIQVSSQSNSTSGTVQKRGKKIEDRGYKNCNLHARITEMEMLANDSEAAQKLIEDSKL